MQTASTFEEIWYNVEWNKESEERTMSKNHWYWTLVVPIKFAILTQEGQIQENDL